MRIAVIGANGQLGSDLCRELASQHNVTPLNHSDIEITDVDNIKSTIDAVKPDLIINTAAYHVVPEAEKYPDRAFHVNGTGALNLARVCADQGLRMLHYSTDYVFDGAKNAPYKETDQTNPLNVYANTKLAGEYFALNNCERSYVVRVSGIYGEVPCRAKGGNFVTTMLRLSNEKPEVKVVDDETLTPTPTREIARTTAELIGTDAFGLYHMSCEGEVTWYNFARAIWDELELETPLLPSSVHDSPVAVKRPFYSVLENYNLNAAGIREMPHWKSALVDFLKDFRNK